ncbi:HU family DNA-binding protein [Cupriavidus malaysiensis]|uniref:DNA-binding protein n=1 Tax=Cupriavidus malaysiensis TaxID=367825 RepID=A0ABM6FGR0_9BURK|nr:HU family DNA-binding protein [Cupriavidus malaysiensis]AOZ11137.1 DNA-binding protein [Cupriavidus malaysiensis]
MATKTTAAKKAAPAKKATPVKKAAPAKSPAAAKKAAAAPVVKPLKDTFTKASLAAHLVTATELDAKTVKTVLAHLENTILSAIHKKGAGQFTLPGLLKVTAQQVAATKKRFGKDPFTGEERWFPAKPATVKVKVRPMKKLKDAAL